MATTHRVQKYFDIELGNTEYDEIVERISINDAKDASLIGGASAIQAIFAPMFSASYLCNADGEILNTILSAAVRTIDTTVDYVIGGVQ